MRTLTFTFPAIERLVYGKPAAETLRAESERLGARRAFLIVSGTMNRTTDEVAKVRTALAERYADVFDGIPPFTPRSAVVEAARAARAADADLIVTFGGGSVTEAGKLVRLCLQHDITDVDGFEPFRIVVDAYGKRTVLTYDGPSITQIAVPTTLSAGEFHAGGGATNERVIAALIAELGMPRRLAEVGIGQEKFSLIAANAMHDRSLHTNPIKIHSPEQILQILESAA